MSAERNVVRAWRAVRAEGVRGVRVPRRQHAVHARRPRGGVSAAALRRRRPVHCARGVLQVLSRYMPCANYGSLLSSRLGILTNIIATDSDNTWLRNSFVGPNSG